MKKFLSLLLVFIMLMSFAPMAFAEKPDDKAKFELYVKSTYTAEAAAGIVKDNGHLYSCPGGKCSCFDIILQADKEAKANEAEKDLKVWLSSRRDNDNVRHDTVVAELELPYNNKRITENKEYLESKQALSKLFEEFYAGEKQAENLYIPTDFIEIQVINSCDYAESLRNSGLSHVEYRLMDKGCLMPDDVALGFYDDSKSDKSKNYIFSYPGKESELEYDVRLRTGGFNIAPDEASVEAGFSLGLSFADNGSVRVMMADNDGKLLPGAMLSAALPEGAGEDIGVALLDENGSTKTLDDCKVEGGRVYFTLPTGDDVFVFE